MRKEVQIQHILLLHIFNMPFRTHNQYQQILVLMEAKKNRISILMLPWLAHGHISPFLELSKKLADRNYHIYLCSTPVNVSSINKRVTEKYSPSIEIVVFHLPSLPNRPPNHHTTNGLSPHLMNTLKRAFEMSMPNFAKILQTINPDLVIYDFNLPGAADCASSVNIPTVQFLTFSAAVIALGIHMYDKPGEMFLFPEIYLSEYKRLSLDKSLTGGKFPFDEGLRRSQNIILMKTCRDFEGKYIDYLSSLISKKIVPVGTLVKESINTEDHGEIIQWLHKKHKGSTVFVSCGSEHFLSKEEIHEVSQGLEISKVNFIWVIRFPEGERTNIQDALPEGFLERVGERGMIMERWAPQAKILQHTLEVSIGVEAERDEDGKLHHQEIAKVIREVLVEERGEAVRKKAKELSDRMKAKGDEEIDGVVEELVALNVHT
ncbi:hypothetical protein P3S68_019934 [Capsicum galapagoense]